MITLRTITLGDDERISSEDYAIIAGFWSGRGYPPPPREILPRLGIIAAREGIPAACAFLYLDAAGSGVCWLSWMATNPEIGRIAAGRALRRVLNFMEGEAVRLNYWLMQATLADPGFVSLMHARDFQSGDRGLTHLYKNLNSWE